MGRDPAEKLTLKREIVRFVGENSGHEVEGIAYALSKYDYDDVREAAIELMDEEILTFDTPEIAGQVTRLEIRLVEGMSEKDIPEE